MKKTFIKNIFRDVKKTISRFISIVIIIAIGVSFYGGIRATSPDMKRSADLYLKDSNFMDFKIIGTMGITDDDIDAVSNLKSISSVEGAYSLDAVVEQGETGLVVNINSLPKEDGINTITIVEGSKPKNDNEIVVEERFLKENSLSIGDTIKLNSGNKTDIKDKLRNNEFKIVASAQSPLYLSINRQLSSVGNGTVKGFVYILPEVFKSSVYTEMYIKADYEEADTSFYKNNDYKHVIDDLNQEIEILGEEQSSNRYDEIIKASYGQTQGLLKPQWYIFDRDDNVGYKGYSEDSTRIDTIGKVFPLIFFLVAALVSLTTITRMVQENRTEIGTFKALGYPKVAIVSHYLLYGLFASVLGSLIGISFGFKTYPPIIMSAYGEMYAIPIKLTPVILSLSIEASLLAIAFTTISAIAATIEELREVPASLIRPKPPKVGKKIFLERINFIWRRLKFTRKVTARNIFRYKQRLLMTVIGIAACTGLMLTGFGVKSSIDVSLRRQFDKIYKYDMQTLLNTKLNDEEKTKLNDKVLRDNNIESTLFTYTTNGTVSDDSSSGEDAYIMVLDNDENVGEYINLIMDDETVTLEDEGVILTKKLSKLLGKKVGDTVEITINDKKAEAKVSAVTEQYMQHFVYMSPKYYEEITGENLAYNSFYALLNSNSSADEEKTSNLLSDVDEINSTSFNTNLQEEYSKNMNSLTTVVIVLIISAGLLAFVVIYNLTNINISERKRELATIKVLGFYNNELASYIYKENIILTIIGIVAGIFMGIAMNNFVLASAETTTMLMARVIKTQYFFFSALLTLVFSLIVNLAMYNKFKKIDMVESLKSAE
ncbi:ABC transporter permease [Clostridium cellulovorans]|uniref:ABC3 transporter permease C-terminal domain-containing protein n=1 Tax=Clostridium cellulovorans (strain ATCC 35296 / DSM 3052 / OCM 3 / 743B) TaxID=573061 RepID=D9SMD5_CLOC7|nr:ABC transporter permease [Clostridium cellulovorans]ADL53791.1 protein of unknown function DUF214 [Clostridium cellulovorans 743B]